MKILKYKLLVNMSVKVLYDGYSYLDGEDIMRANCSCSLITGKDIIVVDTMTPWDSDKLVHALQLHGVKPDDVNYVISTHGHSDHIGNNNLFLKAKHIVGFSVSFQDTYYLHPFETGEEYIINDEVKVIPTPGHTMSDVSVIVQAANGTKIAIAGDLFESEKDIHNPKIWMDAGSEDSRQQRQNRVKICELADWIVPGHGPKFQVSDNMRSALRSQCEFI